MGGGSNGKAREVHGKDRPPRSGYSNAGGSNGEGPSSAQRKIPASFVFVVSELKTYTDNADRWGNPTPPTDPEYFYEENWGGKVFRYYDGHVSQATEYEWVRSNEGYGRGYGRICGRYGALSVFRQCTVFNSGPLLPCIVSSVDASSQYVFDPDNKDKNAAHNDDDGFWDGQFVALKFECPKDGISRACTDGQRHVWSADPAWIPTLVPESFRAPPGVGAKPSRGLCGNLGIILGLMALSARLNAPWEAFEQGWQGHRWHRRRSSNAGPDDDGPGLRGVLVHIAVEGRDIREAEMMKQRLRDIEEKEVLVKG